MSQIHFFRGIAAGALAGLTASWVMNQFKEHRPLQTPGAAKGDGRRHAAQQQPVSKSASAENATVKTAERISQKVLRHHLTPVEKRLAGPAVHYAYGSLIGGLYGGLSELLPSVSAGLGMPFGFALWFLGDEIAVPALGLGKAVTETPVEAHADALSAHFMYGVTTDVLRRILRHIL